MNANSKPEFDSQKVDDLAVAARALLNIDREPNRSDAMEMEISLSKRAKDPSAYNDRYVVESAEAYVSDLDDRAKSGSAEWEDLSRLVDEVKKPLLDDAAQKQRAHALAAQALMNGMGR